MYHPADKIELDLTGQLDFVVPLKQVGLITRAVLEAIRLFYAPRRIIVVSSRSEGEVVRSLSPHWNAGKIDFIDEETFFERNYGLSIKQILAEYDYKREGDQREPGWWIQQLIKLGAATQIPDLSTHYVVWDGDLIPTRRWTLAQRDRKGGVRYFIAILQAEARSQFNSYQYAMCMKALTGDTPRGPQGGGTFVAHHMVFNRHFVAEMLAHMSAFTGTTLPWPLLIMSYSRQFYRFSEYKTYATYMLNRHPAEFHYHPLACYGEGGVRFRDANRVVESMLATCPLGRGGLSYAQIIDYAMTHMEEFRPRHTLTAQEVRQAEPVCTIPGYIQLDHVYGIAKLGLDPTGQPVLANPATAPRAVVEAAAVGNLALTDLITAAYAVTAPRVADDLKPAAIMIEVDVVAAPGNTALSLHAGDCGASAPVGSGGGRVTVGGSEGGGTGSRNSAMIPAGEFKVTRLRVSAGGGGAGGGGAGGGAAARRAARARRVADMEQSKYTAISAAADYISPVVTITTNTIAVPPPVSPTAKEKSSPYKTQPAGEKGIFRWALPS